MNEYESAAFTMQTPSVVIPPIRNEYDTYVTALKEALAKQLVDRKDALTVSTTATHAPILTEIMAEMKKEMTAMMTAMATSKTPDGAVGGDGGYGQNRRRKAAYGKDADGKDLPKYPHCNRPAMLDIF